MTHIPIKNSAPRTSSCHELQSNKLQQMVGIDKFSPIGNHTCNFIYEILKMINNFEKLHMHASLWARSKGHLGWGQKCLSRHVGFKISSIHWKKKVKIPFKLNHDKQLHPFKVVQLGLHTYALSTVRITLVATHQHLQVAITWWNVIYVAQP